MAKKKTLDKYHWHEALDRAFLAVEWFSEFVEQHPAVKRSSKLRNTAQKLTEDLAAFYQAVANADPFLKRSLRPKRRRPRA